MIRHNSKDMEKRRIVAAMWDLSLRMKIAPPLRCCARNNDVAAGLPHALSPRAARTHEASGKTPRQALCAKTFHFSEFRIYGIQPSSWPCQRGVRDRHDMRAGWRWTRQRRRGQRDDRAGNRESSRDAVRHGAVERACRLSGVSTREPSTIGRDRPRTEKSCGPDARGLCVKSQR
jgi:hypothetical protein